MFLSPKAGFFGVQMHYFLNLSKRWTPVTNIEKGHPSLGRMPHIIFILLNIQYKYYSATSTVARRL